MITPIISATSAAPSNSSTTYYALCNAGFGSNADGTQRYQCVPNSGRMAYFFVNLTTAPGAGKSWTFSVRINGVNSVLSFSISDTSTSNSDITNIVSFNAADLIDVEVVPSGSPTAPGRIYYSLLIEDSSLDSAFILGSCGGHGVQGEVGGANGAQEFCGIQGEAVESGLFTPPDLDSRQICTVNGTFRNLYVYIGSTPTSGSLDVTLWKNGTNSAISVALGAGNLGVDSTNTVSAIPGDWFALEFFSNGTGIKATAAAWGIEFVPTTVDDYPFMWGDSVSPSQVSDEYESVFGSPGYNETAWTATESLRYFRSTGIDVKNLYVMTKNSAGQTGSGNSYTFTLRVNSADSLLTTTILETQTNNSSTTTISTLNGDIINMECDPTNTPATTGGTSFGFHTVYTGTNPFTRKPMIFHELSSGDPFIFYEAEDGQPMIFHERA